MSCQVVFSNLLAAILYVKIAVYRKETQQMYKLCLAENKVSVPVDADPDDIIGYLSAGRELLFRKIICCCYNVCPNLKENTCNLSKECAGTSS